MKTFTESIMESLRSNTLHESTGEWVDLGLPSGTKWAACNIGAKSPEECGEYFDDPENAAKEYRNLPSKEQLEELINSCKQRWKTVKGIPGMEFVGLNGNKLFLPTQDDNKYCMHEYGRYCSSEPARLHWLGFHIEIIGRKPEAYLGPVDSSETFMLRLVQK